MSPSLARLCVFGALIMLSGCGGSEPWEKEPQSGLWQQRYTEGSQAGANMVICYAPDQKITLFHDSQPATMENGATCDDAERTATDSGWVSKQTCTLNGTKAVLQYTANGNAETGVSAHFTVSSEQGAQLQPAQSMEIKRVGDCPSGWKPSDYMRIDTQEAGEWRLVHPGDKGAPDTFTVLPTLPPEIEALRH